MYINSINHFRALAILFIIAGHSFEITGLKFDTLSSATLANLIMGGTSLFVFISGFLFHQVFYTRFNYLKFLVKKIKNVAAPYLVLSALPISVLLLMSSSAPAPYFLPEGEGLVNEYIDPGLKYLLTGRTLIGYWYVPFIMVTFFLSPLHMQFIKLNIVYQLSIITVFSVISIFMHRPIDNMSILQSVVYFAPIYLLGIAASINKVFIYDALKGKDLYLLLIVVLLALLEAATGHIGNYDKAAFVLNGIDLMFCQKLVMCFFFMTFLYRFELVKHPWIDIVAGTSFTAFFLHPIMLYVLSSSTLNLHLNEIDSWWFNLLLSVGLALGCILIALAIKKLMPKYSRYIIGY